MRLLINGAAGGLGIQGIQVAKVLSAHVTAIAGSSQTGFLQSYGTDTVYDHNQISIHDINNKFDVILDWTNLLNLEDMKKRLKPNGIFIPAEPNQKNGG